MPERTASAPRQAAFHRPIQRRKTSRQVGGIATFTGLLLSPLIAALAMSLSSVSVIANALRLRAAKVGQD